MEMNINIHTDDTMRWGKSEKKKKKSVRGTNGSMSG